MITTFLFIVSCCLTAFIFWVCAAEYYYIHKERKAMLFYHVWCYVDTAIQTGLSRDSAIKYVRVMEPEEPIKMITKQYNERKQEYLDRGWL